MPEEACNGETRDMQNFAHRGDFFVTRSRMITWFFGRDNSTVHSKGMSYNPRISSEPLNFSVRHRSISLSHNPADLGKSGSLVDKNALVRRYPGGQIIISGD